MAQKQQALGQALGQIASKDTTIASLQANNTALTESVKQQVVRNNQLSEQLANRLQVVQKQNDLLQQDKRTINELTRDLTHAKEAARVKHVLLASAEEKIKELEDKLRMGGFEVSETSDQVASAQGAAIDGSVLAVIADQNVAQLNVGLASGVTEGMRFILYRGDQLVGTMIVATVDANTSAGSLSDLQLTPIQGDKATTSLTSRKGANP